MRVGQRVKIFSIFLSDEHKYMNGMGGTVIRIDNSRVLSCQIELDNGEIEWFSYGELEDAVSME